MDLHRTVHLFECHSAMYLDCGRDTFLLHSILILRKTDSQVRTCACLLSNRCRISYGPAVPIRFLCLWYRYEWIELPVVRRRADLSNAGYIFVAEGSYVQSRLARRYYRCRMIRKGCHTLSLWFVCEWQSCNYMT